MLFNTIMVFKLTIFWPYWSNWCQ